MDERVLWPIIVRFMPDVVLVFPSAGQSGKENTPSGQVDVGVRLRVLVDEFSGWIIRRIASHQLAILVLVYADVINPHRGWESGGDAGKVDGGETVGHAKIEDEGHWLFGNDPLGNVSIWANCFCIQGPHRLVTDEPCDEAFAAGSVVKRILLVGIAIVPVIVQIGKARDSLLIWSSRIRVNRGDGVVVNFEEV